MSTSLAVQERAGAGEPPDSGPVELPQETARPPWRVLLEYVRPHRGMLLLGALLALATGGAGLVLPLVARQLIENLRDGRGIGGLLVAMSVLVLASAVIGVLGRYLLQRTAESVVLSARRKLTSHLLRLCIPAVDRSEPGDLMARATADTTLLRTMTTESLIGFGTGTLLLTGTVVMMAVMDLILLFVTLVVIVLTGSLMAVIVPRIRHATKHAQEALGAVGSTLERVLGALRTVKAAGAEQREESRVHAAARDSWQQSVRAGFWQALVSNTSLLAAQIAFLTVLAVGGARVATGAIGIETLVAFLLYVFYLMTPLQQVVSAVAQYHVGAAAVLRIQEAESLPTEQPGCPAEPRGNHGTEPASLTFEKVRFRYAPELPDVHDSVSFTLPPRGMTAFVGASGAGKSTIFSLVERFYDPSSGQVLLDGRDLRDWEIPALRAAIGYVEQDAPVLSGTLRENLLLGAPGADESTLERVLATTRLANLVDRLPDGLDTLVGHRGTRLSGGERQRVATARALMRSPRMLLLDEATSQLDAVNEAALRDTVADVARATTVLVVAHRLSTVVMADRIVVLDAGRVRAVGTHRQLVEQDPLYAELAATQFLSNSQ